MALYVTDGSTSRTVDPGIIWRQGNVQSSVNNVDIEYSSARDAGYGLFNLQLSNVDVSGYQLLATPMKSSGQIETTGSYGGIFAHGEGDADLDAATSDSFNNNRGFPITAKRTAATKGKGVIVGTINIAIAIAIAIGLLLTVGKSFSS